MKVVVYGTLKRGYGNHYILASGRAEFNGEKIVDGYRLEHHGFPVAVPDENARFLGEVYDIGDTEIDHRAQETLARLDRLESEGYLYNREQLPTGEHFYVGHPNLFPMKNGRNCPIVDGVYVWSR